MSRSALASHARLTAARTQPQGGEEEEEYQRRVKNDELPIHGNDTNYNLNTLLHQNIMQSPYFRELYKFKTYHEVVDEIYYRVDHAEPFAPGTARMPSTCFCLLFKCFTMRLTVKQMNGLLKHTDSPYIRAVGFLYLRYTIDPETLWTWFEPYLDDTEEFNAAANPNDKTYDSGSTETIGKWLKSLLEENNYFGTILPRIPKKIQDSIKVKLLLHGRRQERAKANLAIVQYLKPGTKVRAMYSDEDHDPAMYDAVIDSVEEKNEFWVSFPEYGNTEKLTLGDIEFERAKMPSSSSSSSSRHRGEGRRGERSRSRSASRKRSGSRDRSRDRDHRSGSSRSTRDRRDSRRHRRSRSSSRGRDRSRDRDSSSRGRDRRHRSRSRSAKRRDDSSSTITDDLMAQVREEERRKAAAVGKDYAARPASYKGSLSLKMDSYTTRQRSPTKRTAPPPSSSRRHESRASSDTEQPPSKPAELSREAQDRMRKLREMYGDASRAKQSSDEE